jgi:hypothetical protein
MLLPENGPCLGTFEMQCSFGNREELGREVISVFFLFKWRNNPVVRNLCSAKHELGFISVSGFVFYLNYGQLDSLFCVRFCYRVNVM